jgi:hypothetical protein
MKRSLIVLCAAALLATVPLGRVAVAAKVDKVTVCHNVTYGLDFGTGIEVFGRLMEVPASAVAAHEAHGDRIVSSSDIIIPLTPELRDLFEFLYEINLRNANVLVLVVFVD